MRKGPRMPPDPSRSTREPSVEQKAVLRAVQSTSRWGGNIASDIAHELKVTTQAALNRLRACERAGWVEKYKPDPIWKDRETYWNLTDEGEAALNVR